jgi:hypothetical protein
MSLKYHTEDKLIIIIQYKCSIAISSHYKINLFVGISQSTYVSNFSGDPGATRDVLDTRTTAGGY